MRINATFLRSKVARRIFLLFVSSALLPILALALISFFSVTEQMTEQSRKQLQQASKSEGMEIYERLESLDAQVRVLSLYVHDGYAPVLSPAFKERFTSAAISGPPGMARVLLGRPFRSASFTREQQKYLSSGGTLVVLGPCPVQPSNCTYMARIIDPGRSKPRTLLAEINPVYLFAPEKLPLGMEMCVFASGEALSCDYKPALWHTVGTLKREPGESSRYFTWKQGETQYDAAYWALFLKPRFLAEEWTVVLSQRHEDVVAPMRHFRDTFPYVILLAVWAVILLSSIQIRRTLIPLERLTEGAEQIGAGHFETQVDVRSGDEFEHLAHSFNAMAGRIGKQFHALRTLNDIDQAILASLNRDGIITAVFQHMPDLLPHSCFAVALVHDPRVNDAGTLSVTIPSQKLHRELRETVFSVDDLNQLGGTHKHIQVPAGGRTPGFALPLAGDGMTSFLILPIRVDGQPYGALLCADSHESALSKTELEEARQVADQLAVGFSNVQLLEALEQLHWGALSALARAIDAKSAWTAGHSERVTLFAMKLGRAMGLSRRELQIMNRGGLLHDIGKIGTPPAILDKPGKLDAAELETMRDHVRIGMRILEPIPGLSEALPIIAQHHEWFNGRGYPEGLSGENISLHARIFAVADCYDALVSDRPYRKGLPIEKVVEIIKSGSGTQFDPQVIEVFLRLCASDRERQPQPAYQMDTVQVRG
jgi:putative nucleotidyltransferase with HDIG domain